MKKPQRSSCIFSHKNNAITLNNASEKLVPQQNLNSITAQHNIEKITLEVHRSPNQQHCPHSLPIFNCISKRFIGVARSPFVHFRLGFPSLRHYADMTRVVIKGLICGTGLGFRLLDRIARRSACRLYCVDRLFR
jgi:hypothetical protein